MDGGEKKEQGKAKIRSEAVSNSNVWSLFTQQFYVETDGLRLMTVVNPQLSPLLQVLGGL